MFPQNHGYKKRQAEGDVVLPQAKQTTARGESGEGRGQPVHPDPVDTLPSSGEQPNCDNVPVYDLHVANINPENAFNQRLKGIFEAVTQMGRYNYAGARSRIPSELNIGAWRRCLDDYADGGVVDYLEFGWPINHDRITPLRSVNDNHPSAVQHTADVEHYIEVEKEHGALAGPFVGPPVTNFHVSPLMTRPKRDSQFRRVIMDLSWPRGTAVNDGIDADMYIDGPATITLPTTDYLA